MTWLLLLFVLRGHSGSVLGELGKEYQTLACKAGTTAPRALALYPEFEFRKFKWANEHRTRCSRVEEVNRDCRLLIARVGFTSTNLTEDHGSRRDTNMERGQRNGRKSRAPRNQLRSHEGWELITVI